MTAGLVFAPGRSGTSQHASRQAFLLRFSTFLHATLLIIAAPFLPLIPEEIYVAGLAHQAPAPGTG